MAHVYEIICPKCGQVFQVMKGITVMEAQSGVEIPKSRNEDEPDCCPKCRHRIKVNDPDTSNNVKLIMMID